MTAEQVKALAPATAPEANDSNSNGVADETDVANAKDAIAKAQQAKADADAAAAAADTDENGVISPEEAEAAKQAVDAANEKLATAKDAAEKAIAQVPADKVSELPMTAEQVKALAPATAPEADAPTVTMTLTQDTGDKWDDGITSNGELRLDAPEGYTIDKVTVKGEVVELQDGKIVLPEGEYNPGDIQVTIGKDGKTTTVSSEGSYTIDSTAPAKPVIEENIGVDTTIVLPDNAQQLDVARIHIGEQELIYRKGENGWELDGTAPEGVSLEGNMITIKSELTPVNTTVSVEVFDRAGNSATNSKVIASDKDNDSYSDVEEDVAGSNPNDADNTPRTLAQEAYEKAKEAFDQFNQQKERASADGFTITEVNTLNRLDSTLNLHTLKDNALKAAKLVHTNDHQEDLVKAIEALDASIPEVTNTQGDTVWFSRKDRPEFQQKGLLYTSLGDKDIVDLLKEHPEGVFEIPDETIRIYDRELGKETGYLLDTDGWVAATKSATGKTVAFSEYKVENGHLSIRITNQKTASRISGDVYQDLKLKTDDGSELTVSVRFNHTYSGNKAIDLTGIAFVDNEVPITGAISNNGITDDRTWDNIEVSATTMGSTKDWYIKLEIVDTNNQQEVAWEHEYSQDTLYNKPQAIQQNIRFSPLSAGFRPEDGHTYIIKAKGYRKVDGQIDDNTVNETDELRITADFTPPEVKSKIYTDSSGQLYADFFFKEGEDNLKVWKSNKPLNTQEADAKANYNSALDVTLTDSVWGSKIEDTGSTFVFYDKAGNSRIVDLLKDAQVLRLARLTTNMNKDGGPRNFDSDGNEEQNKDYGSNGLKTASDKDNIIILRQKQGGNGFGGFIDGGTDLPEYKATLQTYDRNDLIDAVGMGGHTDVITRGGDDTLILRKGMSGYGPAGYPGGSFDGPQRILMGSGKDTFSIFGVFKDSYGMNNTTAKVSMGDDDDTISITRSIEADHDSERPYSNYFSLGAGNDKMTVGGTITDTAPKLASNIIDLGSGNDVLTVGGELQDDVLILSKDSSTITVGGIGGQANVTMLLGAGDDTVTVRNSVNYSEARDKAIFKEIYDASLKYTGAYQDDVRSWYEESKDALAKLPDNNYIINLGDGNNTMSVGGNMIHAKIESGSGKDTVTINTWVLSSNNIKLGAGNDSISISSMFKDDSISGQSWIDGGEGRDTINLGTPNRSSNKVELEMYGDIGGNNIDVSSIEVFNLNGKGGTLIIGNKGDIASSYASTIGSIEVHGTNADSVKLHNSWTLKETTNSVEKYEYKDTGIYVFIDEAIKVDQF